VSQLTTEGGREFQVAGAVQRSFADVSASANTVPYYH